MEDEESVQEVDDAGDEPDQVVDVEDDESVEAADAGARNRTKLGIFQTAKDRNDFVVNMRRQGVGYPEIQRRGELSISVSALGNRYARLRRKQRDGVRETR